MKNKKQKVYKLYTKDLQTAITQMQYIHLHFTHNIYYAHHSRTGGQPGIIL